MALITIILGLFLDRHWNSLSQWRQFDWFFKLSNAVLAKTEAHLHNPTGRYLAVLALPILATMLIQDITAEWLPPISFLFAFIVFIYCMGSLNIEQQLEAIIRALKDNKPAEAQAIVDEISPEQSVNDENILELTIQSSLRLIIERLFGVIFWFVILGPVGALLYRLSQQLLTLYADDVVFSKTAERMSGLLNWLPERFLAVSFAITGHFEGAVAAFNDNKETDRSRQYLLFDVCHGALEGNDNDDKAAYLGAFRGLLLRSFIVWLASFAVLSLLGWN
ncbi:MAG: regulatory signaling modulator protein AmpE [Gammaproteobacteria bacterium]|nr:regulatory signaling modulator protein AmpE [Gammaproteobacteria bacterium]